jgi:hypothetical protein
MQGGVLHGSLIILPALSRNTQFSKQGFKPPSDAAPSPKKQAAMERERRLGVRRRAYATPAACGICVARGEEMV